MSNETRNRIDEALFNFYLEADKDTVKDLLCDNIHNIDEYNKKKKQIVFLAKARARKQYNEYLLELADKFQEALMLNIEKPVAILKKLIQDNASLAFYSKLDKLSKEDIIEIIKGKNLVDLLEQLEENDKYN